VVDVNIWISSLMKLPFRDRTKDNFLLALARDGNADYLITGDKDLRDMKVFEKTKIVTLNEFESL